MATQAHCAYCFESLAASFDRRQPLSLRQVQELWEAYEREHGMSTTQDGEDDETVTTQQGGPTDSSSSSVSNAPSAAASNTSKSTTASSISRASQSSSDRHPLFITWNLLSASHQKSLRGCIGTFEAQDLSTGLRSYALTSAFQDHRFSPIPASDLHRLQCSVTLLTNFSAPDKDPMHWTVGKHGLRISFMHNGRRLGATYLPDVAKEQGWTKEEALVSLMRKAGWNGRKDEWRRVQGLEIVRYEGSKVALDYKEWRQWMDWVEARGR